MNPDSLLAFGTTVDWISKFGDVMGAKRADSVGPDSRDTTSSCWLKRPRSAVPLDSTVGYNPQQSCANKTLPIESQLTPNDLGVQNPARRRND